MKASEFAEFFDFEIDYVENKDITPVLNEVFAWGIDEEDAASFTGYEVYDNQGVLSSRYIEKIEDLTECFDSMLNDSIFDDFNEYLESIGIPEVDNIDDILKLLNENPKIKEHYSGDFYELISAFVNPKLIEDDIKPQIEKQRNACDKEM